MTPLESAEICYHSYHKMKILDPLCQNEYHPLRLDIRTLNDPMD